MTAKQAELDRVRSRWKAERDSLGLSDPHKARFALGGLASQCREPDVRLVILPSDPQEQRVNLDEKAMEWLQAPRNTEYGDATDFGQARTTSSAVVIHDRYERPQWEWYYAIHRHGGIDAAHCSLARVDQERRFFFLRQIVSLAWLCLDLQKEAAEQWALQDPFEMILVLRDTQGAFLSDFAEGWEPTFSVYRHSKACLEPSVLLRWEFDREFDPKRIAMDVGARIENAFGSVDQRYLARRGHFEGEFDPR